MDNKRYNTWMRIIGLVLGIIGIAFILAATFAPGTGPAVPIIGKMLVLMGPMFNAIQSQEKKAKNERE